MPSISPVFHGNVAQGGVINFTVNVCPTGSFSIGNNENQESIGNNENQEYNTDSLLEGITLQDLLD